MAAANAAAGMPPGGQGGQPGYVSVQTGLRGGDVH